MNKKEFWLQATIASFYTWWLVDAFYNSNLFGMAFWGTLLGVKMRRIYLVDKVVRQLKS